MGCCDSSTFGLLPCVTCRRVWQSLLLAALLSAKGVAWAAAADLSRAGALAAEGRYQDVHDLLQPFEATSKGDAAFNLLLGEAALRTQRAEQARALFERILALQPDSVEARLGLGRAYLAQGSYARAKIEFETVLRFNELPGSLQQQAEVYARAALEHAQGKRLLSSGYAIVGVGNYRVNSTRATVGGEADDDFHSVRFGGTLNYEFDHGSSLDGSLDYRSRHYDNAERRDDRDLRWSGALSRSLGEGSLAIGLRGRVSYRGDGIYRNDFGLHGSYRLRLDPDNQVAMGAEIRQRRYPAGPLRERTRNIVELTGSWAHSFAEGKASFTLAGRAGREFNTERADGDANFFGLSPSLAFSITDKLGGSVFGWWQNDRYSIERLGAEGDRLVGIGTRNDNQYEVGGGLTWEFRPGWSLNPEILYARDHSNIVAVNYSSTEIWVTLRRDF